MDIKGFTAGLYDMPMNELMYYCSPQLGVLK